MTRLMYSAVLAQLLVLSVVAVPLVGQDPMGPSGFRLGVATEYVVAKGFSIDELKNGAGVRLHTDFRLSSAWAFQLSFTAGSHMGRPDEEHAAAVFSDSGEPLDPADIRFSAYSVTLGPRVRKAVVSDRLGVVGGVDVGVSQFGGGIMSAVSDGYLAGLVLGSEARFFDNVWLTLEAAADIAWVTYSAAIVGYGDGRLFRFRLGLAVPF